MTDDFLRACSEEQKKIGVEIAMLEDRRMISSSEEARVLRVRRLRRVLSRLCSLVEELEAGNA